MLYQSLKTLGLETDLDVKNKEVVSALTAQKAMQGLRSNISPCSTQSKQYFSYVTE